MNRPRAQRALDPKVKEFAERAFVNEVSAKAALLVIHRFARSMEGDDASPQKQRDAIDQLLTFADRHPLPAGMEKYL